MRYSNPGERNIDSLVGWSKRALEDVRTLHPNHKQLVLLNGGIYSEEAAHLAAQRQHTRQQLAEPLREFGGRLKSLIDLLPEMETAEVEMEIRDLNILLLSRLIACGREVRKEDAPKIKIMN